MFSAYFSFIKSILSCSGGRFITAVILMLLLSFADGLGITLLLPLLDQFTKSGTGATGLPEKYLFLGFLPDSFANPYFLILFFSSIALFYTLLKFFQNKNINALSFSFGNFLRQEIYKGLVNANWAFLQSNRNSSYAELLINSVNKITSGARQSVSLMGLMLVVTVNIILSLVISPKAALLFIFLFIIALVFRKFFFTRFYEEGSRHQNHSRQYTGMVMEHLLGMKLAKSFNAEEKHQNAFSEISGRIEQSNQSVFSMQAKSSLQMELFTVIVLCGTLLFIASKQIIITPEWMVLLIIYIRLLPRMNAVSKNFQTIAHTLPLFREVQQLIQKTKNETETSRFGTTKVTSISRGITFSKVQFRYGSREVLLKDFSCFIPAKKATVIMGESGIGKSTLADMLLGLAVPQEGKVLIDDIDIKGTDIKSWREKVGFVPQESFFFYGTLKENLLWGNHEAKEEELQQALKQASLQDWVRQLPEGLDTMVGEQGVQLSGGEKQRMSLARALLRNPELLILDEFTSALDESNEKIITEHLSEWKQRMTIVIISHKSIFTKMADELIDMSRKDLS